VTWAELDFYGLPLIVQVVSVGIYLANRHARAALINLFRMWRVQRLDQIKNQANLVISER
jgi:hypothetical protein